MRRYRFASVAAEALDSQIDYLISRHALQAARALERRVHAYIRDTVCHFPFMGQHIPERDVYETWIPGTKFVVWYTVSDEEIILAMVWHASQDRYREDGR